MTEIRIAKSIVLRIDMDFVIDGINSIGYALTFGIHSRMNDIITRRLIENAVAGSTMTTISIEKTIRTNISASDINTSLLMIK